MLVKEWVEFDFVFVENVLVSLVIEEEEVEVEKAVILFDVFVLFKYEAANTAAVDDEHDDGIGSISFKRVKFSRFLVEVANDGLIGWVVVELIVIDWLDVAIVIVDVPEQSDIQPTVILSKEKKYF